MKTFEIRSKALGQKITEYRTASDTATELDGYPFADFDYIELGAAPAAPSAPADPTASLIDVGPFFDRFGLAKLAVLACEHRTVEAIVRDTTVRKWIDLARPDVVQALDALVAYVPEVTAEIRANVLRVPVAPAENLALRTAYAEYFKGMAHG